jgi:hypothetical protein
LKAPFSIQVVTGHDGTGINCVAGKEQGHSQHLIDAHEAFARLHDTRDEFLAITSCSSQGIDSSFVGSFSAKSEALGKRREAQTDTERVASGPNLRRGEEEPGKQERACRAVST